MNEEQRLANLKKKFGNVRRTGGKGTQRQVQRKQAHRGKKTDDKRLQNALKKLNVSNIPAIEEVNLFKKDGNVVHFENPTVQASIAANTYVVSGECETKNIKDLVPGILPHLGPDSLEQLKDLAGSLSAVGAGSDSDDDSDSDDIPDLVGNFEDHANATSDKATIEIASDDDDDDDDVPDLVEATPASGDAANAPDELD